MLRKPGPLFPIPLPISFPLVARLMKAIIGFGGRHKLDGNSTVIISRVSIVRVLYELEKHSITVFGSDVLSDILQTFIRKLAFPVCI